MRSFCLSIVLATTALVLTATLPSQAEARPGRGGWGGYRRWGGRAWDSRWGWGGYYPYGASYYSGYPYYANYGGYYPTYGSAPSSDYGAAYSMYSLPYSGSSGSGSSQAELPHPTGGVAVPPPDAALIRLRVPDQFADVFFDGLKTSSVGITREYVTPQLESGKKYGYTITVAWGQGDRRTAMERTLKVERGQTATLDFTRPSAGAAK